MIIGRGFMTVFIYRPNGVDSCGKVSNKLLKVLDGYQISQRFSSFWGTRNSFNTFLKPAIGSFVKFIDSLHCGDSKILLKIHIRNKTNFVR